MSRHSKTGRRAERFCLQSSVAALIAASATMSVAVAQDIDEDDGDEIVVTGSRIARDANLSAPTAVTTVGQDAITFSGETNLSSILRQVPSFGVSGLSSTNSNFTLQSGGINTLELRNLGSARTLVLQNGRRIVAGLPGSNIVDFNLIPTDLIERIEVVTGGASAIYGSDALSGVVNIILKDDFEGVQFTTQYGRSAFQDNQEYSFRATVGGNFADGKGNAVVSAEYVNNQGIASSNRPNTRTDDIAFCLFTGNPDDCQTPVEPFFSSFPPQGRFIIEDAAAGTASSFNPDGRPFNTNGTPDGFNRQDFRTISVPVERFGLNANAKYSLYEGDSFTAEAFLEGSYGSSSTSTAFEPVPLESDDIFGQGDTVGVSIDNPFVPDAIRDLALAAGDDSIGFKRRTVELGGRGNTALRETFRIVAGLQGTLAEDYNWETFINYGRTNRSQETQASVNVLAFRDALNADLDPVTGLPQCADLAARLKGCVPINIFGEGAISPGAADYVRHVGTINATIEQTSFGATLAGPVPGVELPAGTIDFAAGLEWRREFSDNQPDGLQQAGLTSGNAIPGNRGQFEVFELFGETDIPLVKDQPFFHDLTIGGAYRYSDYTTVGVTHAYAARASWAPVEDLRFRFQYAKAVRAPNIGELFNNGTENFATIADPCNNLNGQTDQAIVTTCLQDPLVQVRLGATGDFVLTQDEIQGTGGFSGVGNLDLDPEEGKSLNVGMIYNTDFGTAGTFAFSVDYFNIDIDGFIAQPGRQFTLDQCYGSGDFANNQFCGFLVRDTQGLASTQGELLQVNTGVVNSGFVETSGIDFSVAHTLGLDDVGLGFVGNIIPNGDGAGSLTTRVNYTYLLNYDQEIFGAFEDQTGEVGLFNHEILAGWVYANGPFTFTWDTTWLSDAPVDDDPAGNIFDFNVGDYFRHDMQVRYGVNDGLAEFFFGLNNITNAEPPNILTGVPGNATGTDTQPEVYDVIGRTWYGGVRVRF
ncbi:MAG: TonB-dependent receptor [Pseudomonadota bacterium]